MRTAFEPLHPEGVPAARPFAHQYLDPGARMPALETLLDAVFAGEKGSLWINYRIRPDRFNPLRYGPIPIYLHIKKSVQLLRKYAFTTGLNGLIVKFIRANLMLPWLARHYGYPMMLVVRHPCAVIASRFKLPASNWGAEAALERYRSNERIYRLVGEEFGIDIAEPMSPAAALCCVWCIENVLPVQWAQIEHYGIVAYENLLVHPQVAWESVIRHLGLAKVPDIHLLGKPSQQSAPDMRDRKFAPVHIDRWRTQLRPEEIEAIARMLDRFGCGLYSVDHAEPVGSSLVLKD